MKALADVMRGGFGQAGLTPPAMLRSAETMGLDVFHGRIRAKLEQMDPMAFEALGALLADHESVETRLGEIGCPTLVIVGEQDRAFLAPSEIMQRGIADAKLVVVKDAAHSPQLESPDAWREAIIGHLGRARA